MPLTMAAMTRVHHIDRVDSLGKQCEYHDEEDIESTDSHMFDHYK